MYFNLEFMDHHTTFPVVCSYYSSNSILVIQKLSGCSALRYIPHQKAQSCEEVNFNVGVPDSRKTTKMANSSKPQKYVKLNIPVVTVPNPTYGSDFVLEIVCHVNINKDDKTNQDLPLLEEEGISYETKDEKMSTSKCAGDQFKDGTNVQIAATQSPKMRSKGAGDHLEDLEVVETTNSWNPKKYVKLNLPVQSLCTPIHANCDLEYDLKVNDEVEHGLDKDIQKLNVQQYNDHHKAPVEEGLPLHRKNIRTMQHDPKELLRPIYNIYVEWMVFFKIKNIQTFEEWLFSLKSAAFPTVKEAQALDHNVRDKKKPQSVFKSPISRRVVRQKSVNMLSKMRNRLSASLSWERLRRIVCCFSI
ncbi:uncharacterized protein LOC121387096 isoform X2 [Gigantopelta aegis]|uniref:uncharacterized protein LOC121387096 isoform X2 n=1 Tax=Gigantopelta aegis TaxID=1735272 RepID=UPI001B88D4A6|nr:uncharacterized protein LOC121387096 isoform X2 [Gigantopelta aegis]